MDKNKIKNEILSPAGSIATLYAGINAGADAVYIGGQKFGARAYADNPEQEELLRAIDYVHLHGKKIYLTVNTLLKNAEIEEQLYDYLMPLYQQGLDAVIVQDIGVFNFIRDNFDDFDIHASTQMAVCGTDGARLLKKMGASRVVTARELSLKELKEIHDNVDIEIESFIHGAMCYSYSGMCLFSSMVGGRSGNRGRCAGSCRQPYEVYKNNKRCNHNNNLYALSLKDMNTLEIIPDIIDCGVYSLKIEGRMKSPEYAAGVVSVYRKYVDLYHEKGRENFRIDQNDINNLSDLYSRSGSTTGYYKCHNSKKMVSFHKPAYKSENDNFIKEMNDKYCNRKQKVNAEALIKLESGKPMALTIGNMNSDSVNSAAVTVLGEEVGTAINRPVTKADILKQLNKTGDSFIEFSKLEIVMENNIFVPVSKLNELRREGIRIYEEKILHQYRRNDKQQKDVKLEADMLLNDAKSETDLSPNGGTLENYRYPHDVNIKTGIHLSDVNSENAAHSKESIHISCQVNTFEQLSCALAFKEINTIYVSTDLLTESECMEVVKRTIACGKKCIIELPYIYRERGKKYITDIVKAIDNPENQIVNSGSVPSDTVTYMVKNIDELGLMINKGISNFIVDSSMYAFNSYAKELFYKNGADRVTLPYELNFKELKKLADRRDELVIYGRVPLMVTAGCVNKNYDNCSVYAGKEGKRNEFLTLKDRTGAEFTAVSCCNFCYNILYNCVPVSLLGVHDKVAKLKTHNYRINLTIENDAQSEEVLEKYIKVFYYREYSEELKKFTRGHFNRGVD